MASHAKEEVITSFKQLLEEHPNWKKIADSSIEEAQFLVFNGKNFTEIGLNLFNQTYHFFIQNKEVIITIGVVYVTIMACYQAM